MRHRAEEAVSDLLAAADGIAGRAIESARGVEIDNAIRGAAPQQGVVDAPGPALRNESASELPRAVRGLGNGRGERGRMEIVFPLPMAVLMKVARLLPVRVWAAISRRMTNR